MRAINSSSRKQPDQHAAPARFQAGHSLAALAIFIVAFAARLIFLFNSPDRDWPHSIFYEGDAVMWVEWAGQIDQRLPFQFDLPIHPPAVAYTLAYAYDGVRQSGFLGLKILWCAMSAGACALTCLACAATLGRRIGVIAALLLCFSFNQYLLATSINSETPYVLLLPAMVLLTHRAVDSPNRWLLAILGALHGFALLLRPEHPVLMLLFGAWMLCSRGRRVSAAPPGVAAARPRLPLRARLIAIALMGAVALLVCVPWTVHAVLATKRFNDSTLGLTKAAIVEGAPAPTINFNFAPIGWSDDARALINALPAFAREDNFIVINHWAQQQRLDEVNAADVTRFFIEQFGWIPRPLPQAVLISNQGPFSFALANHPESDGGFSRAALAHPLRGPDPPFAFAFPPHNRVFIDGWRVGWDYLRADPAASLRNIGRKFQRFADGVTCGFGASNAPLGREGVRAAVDMFVADGPAARPWQIALLAMIAAGVVLALTRRLPVGLWLLVILYKLIITLLFYGYARQGASIAPAFYVCIAVLVDSLLIPIDRRWPAWREPLRAFTIALCVVALILDVLAMRGEERGIVVVGRPVPRPELGANAWTAFSEIEIRKEPM